MAQYDQQKKNSIKFIEQPQVQAQFVLNDTKVNLLQISKTFKIKFKVILIKG